VPLLGQPAVQLVDQLTERTGQQQRKLESEPVHGVRHPSGQIDNLVYYLRQPG
jgi:hypothetical protein